MAYKKQTWVDDETVGTADRFNHMESGIEEAGKTGGVSTGAVIGWTGEEIPEGYEEVDSSLIPSGVEVGTIVHIPKDEETPEGYIDVNGKSFIQIYGDAYTLTTANKERLPLTKTSVLVGDGFELLDSGVIKVKKKMYAKAVGQIMLTTNKGGSKTLIIGLNLNDWGYEGIANINTYVNMRVVSRIIQLNVDDLISLNLKGAIGDITHNAEYITFLTVEEVDGPTKSIQKASVTPIEPKTGHIYDTTNIDNKAENTYSAETIDKLNSYSTTEQFIGYWIDGKPIYRKVVDFGALPNNDIRTLGQNITNVKTLVNFYAVADNGLEGLKLPNTYAGSAQNYIDGVTVKFTNNTLSNINIRTNSDRSAYTAHVVLEYTKTTD